LEDLEVKHPVDDRGLLDIQEIHPKCLGLSRRIGRRSGAPLKGQL
jgi:hypothetical protein